MRNRKTWVYLHLLAAIAVLLVCLSRHAGGAETGGGVDAPSDIATADGRVFRNIRVIRVEPDALLIEHKDGLARLPFFSLSAEIQRKYDFDPIEALRYSEMLTRKEQSRQEGVAAESELQRIARERGKREAEAGSHKERGEASEMGSSSRSPVRRSRDKAAMELEVLAGRFGGIRMGMRESEVREELKSGGFRYLSEMPYGKNGKLITIDKDYSPGGINFRFTEDGRLFQIYALRTKVPIEGGLVLGTSTIREYENVLDCTLKGYLAANGDQAFSVIKGDIKVSFHPEKDNPEAIFSIMVTDNGN